MMSRIIVIELFALSILDMAMMMSRVLHNALGQKVDDKPYAIEHSEKSRNQIPNFIAYYPPWRADMHRRYLQNNFDYSLPKNVGQTAIERVLSQVGAQSFQNNSLVPLIALNHLY